MQGTVDGFGHGLVTPVAAYLMACLGGALGLRCTTRSLRTPGAPRPGWLVLGATSIGAGIWTMHFIAMAGFRIEGVPIVYDRPITLASLAVAILMVGVGIFVVALRGRTAMALVTGGTVTGLGIATMHYLGMAGMRLPGRIEYDTPVVALSVAIAVVAATTALWAAVSVRGFAASVGASLVLGLAVTGMHYTGMAAASVHLHGAATAHVPAHPTGPVGAVDAAGAAEAVGAGAADAVDGALDAAVTAGGGTASASLAPLLVGPAAFLLLAGVVVLFDPALVGGDPPGRHPADPRAHLPGIPAPRHRDRDADH
ncbi:MHYT domain-containing protein [Streptomyces roseolilacinus]|uniref:Membrane protein n=1 Tax=Streptomyces roseolilacinus TaxID=66904 RepID=A0A918EP69_9ACTN|nr:MHYT domain-containing protein [Streptomyces roseolilacinus]GGQ25339.1 membrane protein [Streptomyces roseolilacinus]